MKTDTLPAIKAVKHPDGWGWTYAGNDGPPFGCYRTKAKAIAAGEAKAQPTAPSKNDKMAILDAFLREIRRIGVGQINAGFDAGDPLAQVRAACNVIETAFNQSTTHAN